MISLKMTASLSVALLRSPRIISVVHMNGKLKEQAENCILNILWQMDGQAFIETFVIKRYFKMKSTWFSPILGTVQILQNRIVQPGSLMYEF